MHFRFRIIILVTVISLFLFSSPALAADYIGKRIEVEATAYSPEDPGLSSTTATGMTLRKGIIAVDPDFIPLGSRVYIPGYGEAVAADTGGAIVGNIIDIAFNTHAEAIEFGRQWIEIVLLDVDEEDVGTGSLAGNDTDDDEQSIYQDDREDEEEIENNENEEIAEVDEEAEARLDEEREEAAADNDED